MAEPVTKLKPRTSLKLPLMITGIVLLFVAAGLYLFSLTPTGSDFYKTITGQSTTKSDETTKTPQEQVQEALQSGDIDAARETAQQQYDKNPTAEASKLLIQVEVSGGDYQKVVDVTNKMSEQDRDYQDYNTLADAYTELGNTSAAIAAYQRTIELWPKDDLQYKAEVEYFQTTIELLKNGGGNEEI